MFISSSPLAQGCPVALFHLAVAVLALLVVRLLHHRATPTPRPGQGRRAQRLATMAVWLQWYLAPIALIAVAFALRPDTGLLILIGCLCCASALAIPLLARQASWSSLGGLAIAGGGFISFNGVLLLSEVGWWAYPLSLAVNGYSVAICWLVTGRLPQPAGRTLSAV